MEGFAGLAAVQAERKDLQTAGRVSRSPSTQEKPLNGTQAVSNFILTKGILNLSPPL